MISKRADWTLEKVLKKIIPTNIITAVISNFFILPVFIEFVCFKKQNLVILT
jgi:hypothetical protein